MFFSLLLTSYLFICHSPLFPLKITDILLFLSWNEHCSPSWTTLNIDVFSNRNKYKPVPISKKKHVCTKLYKLYINNTHTHTLFPHFPWSGHHFFFQLTTKNQPMCQASQASAPRWLLAVGDLPSAKNPTSISLLPAPEAGQPGRCRAVTEPLQK